MFANNQDKTVDECQVLIFQYLSPILYVYRFNLVIVNKESSEIDKRKTS